MNPLFQHDQQWRQQHGITHLAGVDEVGRGPLAGPVCAAAVILPAHFYHLEIRDSKRLNPRKRRQLAVVIQESALAYSVSTVSPHQIDRINIRQATRKAMQQAAWELPTVPEHIVLDGNESALSLPAHHTSIVKGDQLSLCIAAASILAKVYRDAIMDHYDTIFPQYGFTKHKGYGTAQHRQALLFHGLTPIHRRSFCRNFPDSSW
ncbi:ribonuclease HII [Desulfurispira natronophila]|uniref:Ribonuclease HII n=1 Tax=Desulfurispira natronophila TaxID=682562 RepID=A0A7W7Y6D2_9BACT|nr:ribonuclease HII [Desulfurispira natronophila]MBB5022903.1 ribonuclease HII [Desulfurispira natronophila]